jgi:hypothetical protein
LNGSAGRAKHGSPIKNNWKHINAMIMYGSQFFTKHGIKKTPGSNEWKFIGAWGWNLILWA